MPHKHFEISHKIAKKATQLYVNFYVKQDECDRRTSRCSTARPRVCGPARAGLQPVQAGAGCRPASPVALAKTAATVRKCAFSPNCWGTGVGWGVGWKWAPIGGLQYQTHMQAPKYDVQFQRSEALRSSSSSSRTRQIKECKIASCFLYLMRTCCLHGFLGRLPKVVLII